MFIDSLPFKNLLKKLEWNKRTIAGVLETKPLNKIAIAPFITYDILGVFWKLTVRIMKLLFW